MKRVKQIAALACVLALLTGLAGCAVPAPEASAPPEPSPTAVPVPEPRPEPSPEPAPEPAPEPPPSPPPKNAIVLEEEIDWICGVPWTDPGWTAYGPEGEDLSEKVKISGRIREWRQGDQTLRYTLSDKNGLIASAARTVHVLPQQIPEAVEPAAGTIYLTFDDGPCENTDKVLAVLEKYGVKATFFIVARKVKYLDRLPRIREGGHTIGIHAHTHPNQDYSGFYRNEDAYFTDFLNAQRVLYEYTGEYAYCARFPGGTKTASFLAGTLKGKYGELYGILHDMGITSYDWNLQPESGSKTTEGTLSDFQRGLSPEGWYIVLQHDTRLFSVEALDQMISWALEQGYRFSAIEPTTPELHFRKSE